MKGKTFHLNVEESTCGSGLWLCLPLSPPGGSVSTLQKQNWGPYQEKKNKTLNTTTAY